MEANNKLREALEKCANWGEQIDYQLGSSAETVYAFSHERCLAHNISECARAVLATPVRNCDVGTADDWLARFSVVCERCSGSDCDHRLFKDEEVCDCFARWLQMPYEEQEGGAE